MFKENKLFFSSFVILLYKEMTPVNIACQSLKMDFNMFLIRLLVPSTFKELLQKTIFSVFLYYTMAFTIAEAMNLEDLFYPLTAKTEEKLNALALEMANQSIRAQNELIAQNKMLHIVVYDGYQYCIDPARKLIPYFPDDFDNSILQKLHDTLILPEDKEVINRFREFFYAQFWFSMFELAKDDITTEFTKFYVNLTLNLIPYYVDFETPHVDTLLQNLNFSFSIENCKNQSIYHLINCPTHLIARSPFDVSATQPYHDYLNYSIEFDKITANIKKTYDIPERARDFISETNRHTDVILATNMQRLEIKKEILLLQQDHHFQMMAAVGLGAGIISLGIASTFI